MTEDLLMNKKLVLGEKAELVNPLGINAISCQDGKRYVIEFDMIYQQGNIFSCFCTVKATHIEKFLSFFDLKPKEISHVRNIIGSGIRLVYDDPIRPKFLPLLITGVTEELEYEGDKFPAPLISVLAVQGEENSYTLELKGDDSEQGPSV